MNDSCMYKLQHTPPCTMNWKWKMDNRIVDTMRIHMRRSIYLHCNLVAQSNAVQGSTDVYRESQTRNKLCEVVLTELLGLEDLCPTLTHVRQLLHQHTGAETSLQDYQEQECIKTGGFYLKLV